MLFFHLFAAGHHTAEGKEDIKTSHHHIHGVGGPVKIIKIFIHHKDKSRQRSSQDQKIGDDGREQKDSKHGIGHKVPMPCHAQNVTEKGKCDRRDQDKIDHI